MPTLNLPIAHGKLAPYTTKPPRHLPAAKPPFNRIAYAAAHVVADPFADGDPWLDCAIDWDRTIAFRRHLWSLGLGVAEAMDTAQRGMGVDWPTSLELIRRSLDAAKDFPGARHRARGCSRRPATPVGFAGAQYVNATRTRDRRLSFAQRLHLP